MAYTKNTWADGDIVTSEKLNHMEDGIANSESVMIINNNDGTLDKTWQEIHDAMEANTFCVIKKTAQGLGMSGVQNYLITEALNDEAEGSYIVSAILNPNISETYTTTSATGYPKSSAAI